MPRAYAMVKLVETDKKLKKRSQKAKEAVLLHAAAMFNINKCNLDWFPARQNTNDYVNLLSELAVAERADVLNGD